MKTLFAGLTVAAIVSAGAVTAQEKGPFAMQIKARQGIMAYRAVNLGVLGGMAKGETEYNAEAAQKAADNLATAVAIDASMLWPKGSDHDADPTSEALAAIWADGSDIGAKAKAMSDAAAAMQAAAGKDIDSLKAAMGPVGEACAGCHKSFRVPQN